MPRAVDASLACQNESSKPCADQERLVRLNRTTRLVRAQAAVSDSPGGATEKWYGAHVWRKSTWLARWRGEPASRYRASQATVGPWLRTSPRCPPGCET